MYDKEVLGKFPVVQHFYFGNIFRWSIEEQFFSSTSGHQQQEKVFANITTSPIESTRAPLVSKPSTVISQSISQPITTRAPWASTKPPPSHTPAETSTYTLPIPTQLDGADSIAPWTSSSPKQILPDSNNSIPPWERGKQQNEEDIEADGANIISHANLGPRRTNSPDSAMARTGTLVGSGGFGGGCPPRVVTGGVRVAEKGDLSGRRASRIE
jgi:serine/threonine-protein phosphatase 2A activator